MTKILFTYTKMIHVPNAKCYLEHCGANHKHLSCAYRREGKRPLATEPHITDH